MNQVAEIPANENRIRFRPGIDSRVCTNALETYAYARREAIVLDLITLVSAVEFADRSVIRSTKQWSRSLELQIPVYELERWKGGSVGRSLIDLLSFLTGDQWIIAFEQREGEPLPKPQDVFPFDSNIRSVMAYSDGLDSRAVAHLYPSDESELMRVRVGSKANAGVWRGRRAVPFTGIPYELHLSKSHREPSARSRGLKFTVAGALAAYLLDIEQVVVPESGQGIFGPALVPVGRTYFDYRNHPLLTSKVEKFIYELLGHQVSFVFPRLWNTKGETLRDYSATGRDDWSKTRSCWQDSRWSSVDGQRRHCGICAACLLRRVSVHAAGLSEPIDHYVVERLGSSELEDAVAPGFQVGKAFREYAIAGALQMEHFALENEAQNRPRLQRHASSIAPLVGLSNEEAMDNLSDLISRHAQEWTHFLSACGDSSFINQWVRG